MFNFISVVSFHFHHKISPSFHGSHFSQLILYRILYKMIGWIDINVLNKRVSRVSVKWAPNHFVQLIRRKETCKARYRFVSKSHTEFHDNISITNNYFVITLKTLFLLSLQNEAQFQ